MARIRSIKPDFFRHEGLYNAERASKLPLRVAFAGLWTAADREGRFQWKPRQLKLDCLPYDDNVDFANVLDALSRCGFIRKYEVDGEAYGYIPSWHEHQVINQREAQSKLPEPSDASMCAHSTEQVQTHGEGKGREGNRKGKEVEGETREVALSSDEPSFEAFWHVWPNKVGKPAAMKAMRSALKRASINDICSGAWAYIQNKPPDRPWLNPATFLNQDRWKDQPAPTAKPLTEHQTRRRETQDILHALDKYAGNGGEGGEANSGILPGDTGERSAGIRGGSGGNLIELSSGGIATRR